MLSDIKREENMEKELIELFRSLPEDRQQLYLEYLRKLIPAEKQEK